MRVALSVSFYIKIVSLGFRDLLRNDSESLASFTNLDLGRLFSDDGAKSTFHNARICGIILDVEYTTDRPLPCVVYGQDQAFHQPVD